MADAISLNQTEGVLLTCLANLWLCLQQKTNVLHSAIIRVPLLVGVKAVHRFKMLSEHAKLLIRQLAFRNFHSHVSVHLAGLHPQQYWYTHLHQDSSNKYLSLLANYSGDLSRPSYLEGTLKD